MLSGPSLCVACVRSQYATTMALDMGHAECPTHTPIAGYTFCRDAGIRDEGRSEIVRGANAGVGKLPCLKTKCCSHMQIELHETAQFVQFYLYFCFSCSSRAKADHVRPAFPLRCAIAI